MIHIWTNVTSGIQKNCFEEKSSDSRSSHFGLVELITPFGVLILIGASLFPVYPQGDALFINSKGQVGIGTKNPDADLHTAGDVKIDSSLTVGGSLAVKKEVQSGGRIIDKTGIVMPVGTILSFAGDSSKIPQGWILCDGRAVKSSDYPDLYNIIGTNYGNGSNSNGNACQFNVPDLRGVFLRGVDGSRGLDPDKVSRDVNNPGGNSKNMVGSQQGYGIEKHKHDTPFPGSHFLLWPANGHGSWPEQNQNGGPEDYSTQVSSTAETGGNETRPVNVYVNFIIKY